MPAPSTRLHGGPLHRDGGPGTAARTAGAVTDVHKECAPAAAGGGGKFHVQNAFVLRGANPNEYHFMLHQR